MKALYIECDNNSRQECMTSYSEGLTAEESGLFIELFETSLRINQREQLFSWLQGSFQYLFPHEVLLCGIRPENEQSLHFESFISTRYVTEQHIQQATKTAEGLITRGITAWKSHHRPIFIADGLGVGDYGNHHVPFVEVPGALQQIELKNMAAHGLASRTGEVLSFFSFSRIPGQLSAKHAYLLELLVPHLHAVLLRICTTKDVRPGMTNRSLPALVARPISAREKEVLNWLQAGKTNAEIAAILGISPMTVKNQVHSILRKLGVENRSNAVSKAKELGLF